MTISEVIATITLPMLGRVAVSGEFYPNRQSFLVGKLRKIEEQSMARHTGMANGQENYHDREAEVRSYTDSATVDVWIADLRMADSPRLHGVDDDHVRLLAEVQDQLPPILVHRATMRVIDGVHRCRAAQLRGRVQIAARFFDGSPDDAFRVAVEANVRHGLRLSLAERRTAAARIIRTNPELSDRRIATTAGLAARTVAAIRARTVGAEAAVRVGKDGRARPLNTAEGRRIAGRAIIERPDLSLRQIAKEAGISVATVRDVRARVQSGEQPAPVGVGERVPGDVTQLHPRGPGSAGTRAQNPAGASPPQRGGLAQLSDPLVILKGLQRDPSLRYTESGRSLLRWLNSSGIASAKWRDALRTIPPHCAIMIARIARRYGNEWITFADELERRDRASNTNYELSELA
ncbi:ParB N-terminal domain-containing protein [Micromonospora sp. NPDC093277]|uniref:ParB/RepB/Spo0J family partition protein n=1 Tax=Micromonospora sp. NPDC093277 TaxID=3364291 RepID=UPI00381C5808